MPLKLLESSLVMLFSERWSTARNKVNQYHEGRPLISLSALDRIRLLPTISGDESNLQDNHYTWFI